MTLQLLHSEYEENLIFFFLSVDSTAPCTLDKYYRYRQCLLTRQKHSLGLKENGKGSGVSRSAKRPVSVYHPPASARPQSQAAGILRTRSLTSQSVLYRPLNPAYIVSTGDQCHEFFMEWSAHQLPISCHSQPPKILWCFRPNNILNWKKWIETKNRLI